MLTEITTKEIFDLGEAYRRRIIETATPEERLAGLEPQERLAGLEPQELALLRAQLDALFQSPAANADEPQKPT